MTLQTAFPWHENNHFNDFFGQPKTLGQYISKYNAPDQGVKFDQGKDMWHLVPFDVMQDEVRVWMHGAQKYGENNWRKGLPLTQCYNAALRHIFAFMNGEDNDPESGYSHLAHAVCCLKMMQYSVQKFPQLDDRNEIKEV